LAAKLGGVIDPFPPEHMDKYSRNERLYRFLLGIGLYVVPIRLSDDANHIDYLHVSVTPEPATPNRVPEMPAETGVALTVERLEVRDVIRSAECSGDGVVIDLPTIRR
jgi:hypothetical protein